MDEPGFAGLGGIQDPHLTTEFQMLTAPARGALGPAEKLSKRSTSSSSIAAWNGGALIADTDSGSLVMTDKDGKVTARLPVDGAAQVAVDRIAKRAYVSDRRGDRIVVAQLAASSLSRVASWTTTREPHGLALTPNGRFLLVSTVADHTLEAFDTRTGKRAWSSELLAEPRGLAVSPDGTEATITFLTASAVAKVDLASTSKAPRYVPIGRPHTAASNHAIGGVPQAAQIGPQAIKVPQRRIRKRRRKRAIFRPPTPRGPVKTFARGAFATAYMTNQVAVVPYHRATPIQNTGRQESRGTYGGGGVSSPPIVHRIAMVGPQGDTARAHLDVRVPRAVAYDAARDFLYVAGKGDDKVTLIADASQPTAHFGGKVTLRALASPRFTSKNLVINGVRSIAFSKRCGPTGLAIADDGDLLVHCGLSHSLTRVKLTPKTSTVEHHGADLGGSRLSKDVQTGREMFFRANDTRMSGLGAFACANCHPDARADGLSWRIQGATLQTPFLTGRLQGTHPFKWDGQDKDLTTSLSMTLRRLGGTGLRTGDIKPLRAFLESLDKPRAPTPKSAVAIARGKHLFASESVGCASCHSGNQLTDQQAYDLAEDLKTVDTPSLVGIAHSAPYYHDGSAATLEAVLLENGNIHGMGRLAKLTTRDRSDLIAYLETL